MANTGNLEIDGARQVNKVLDEARKAGRTTTQSFVLISTERGVHD